MENWDAEMRNTQRFNNITERSGRHPNIKFLRTKHYQRLAFNKQSDIKGKICVYHSIRLNERNKNVVLHQNQSNWLSGKNLETVS